MSVQILLGVVALAWATLRIWYFLRWRDVSIAGFENWNPWVQVPLVLVLAVVFDPLPTLEGKWWRVVGNSFFWLETAAIVSVGCFALIEALA